MPSSEQPLTVLFLPTYDGNPYQPTLWDALSSYDVDVIPGDHTDPLPIAKHLLKDRPDVVHLHWMDALVSSDNPIFAALLSLRLLFELTLCKLLGVRVVWTVHNYLGHEAEQPKLELWLRRVVARSADSILVHSEGVRSKIADGYEVPDDERSKVVAVDHGHFIEAYENTMSREEARDSLGFEDDETVFLFFGNVKPYKGMDDLLAAFESFGDDAKLLIAGQPPKDDEAERELRERCEADENITAALEFIDDDEIQRYMRAADAATIPFDRILTSGSAILAMSYENVVIAPKIGCLPDVLSQTEEFLYQPNDDDGLESTMRHALDADVEAAGQRNFERVQEFDWDAIAARTRRIYDGEDVPPNGREQTHEVAGKQRRR